MMDMNQEELIKYVTKLVIEKIYSTNKIEVPVGISNRHIHLSSNDLSVLFGENYCLTKIKDLKQPNEFASAETLTVKGPKGKLEKVRILGPVRQETQVEISISDSFALGVKPVIAESGMLENTPGITLIGPSGTVDIRRGTIVALRHIHMPKTQADKLSLKDKEMVDVKIDGVRGGVLGQVLLRVSDKYALEMHVDVDEANACNLKNGNIVTIIKKEE